MEQTTSQELDKKIFSDLIHDPSVITADDSEVLASLLKKYPYVQLLRSFYTRSLVHSPSTTFEKELMKTALFSNDRIVLQTIIEDPESLRSKPRKITFAGQEIAGTFDAAPFQEEAHETAATSNKADVIAEPETTIPEKLTNTEAEKDYSLEEAFEKALVEDSGPEERVEKDLARTPTAEPDRIAVDLTADKQKQLGEEQRRDKDNNLAGNLIDSLVNDDVSSPVIASPEPDELDLLIKQNVASADILKEHVAQDTKLDKTENVFTPEVDIAENITHNAVLTDQQKISKYDDDKMPYSFLWWLNKTRNEHVDNYQPYVSFQLDTSQSIKRNTVDQLSTQIIENIFHLQSPVDELMNAPKTVPFQVKRKEDFIVERFIREEPQIKPPNSEKLDNENKARKSAEDPNDLVSETLAHIYTDQMLFHKAIETFKKLSLKFPEKSTYFADQIRELEKKLN